MRLLVAEADTSLAEFLQTRLQQEHFAVQLASTGDQISKFGEKSLFDLILLDLNLPGVPGPDYLRHLQSRWPEAPVVLLSSASSVEERIKGLDAGADDIIMNPSRGRSWRLASAQCCAGATGLRGKFFSMRIWK